MKKIAIITATRAEYGLLSPIIAELRKYESNEFKTILVVTGTHLVEKYGKTINEIERDNHRIDFIIDIPIGSSSAFDISHNQAEALTKFTCLFSSERFDAVMLLGDRYEMLAIAIAAVNTLTPIFHLCGGDVTEGAMDDCIRHSITKMSYLHFVSNEESRRRVIQLGEEPGRVYNYGSTSVDNIIGRADMSRREALASVGLKECKYALCTFHPVTLEAGSVGRQLESLLDAMQHTSDIEFIVTKSNADQGGSYINELLEVVASKISNIHIYSSLGVRRYLSLMKYAEFVIGNSSSGIMETPAFRIPTVNIGNRQKGRLRATNIIDCNDDVISIINAISTVRSNDFKAICEQTVNPYGEGKASQLIAKKSIEIMEKGISLQKKFYDLSFSVH